MSNTTAHDTPEKPQRPMGSWWRKRLHRHLETAGFWAAVGLPVVYLPMLLTTPVPPAEAHLVAVLIVAHAIALLVGHSHDPT